MLTRLAIRNFKRFESAEIELGKAVVLIGPNNSGKTTALQALALWDIGLRKWLDKRQGRGAAERRPGVAVNRRDLIAIPVPNANLLWRDLHVRSIVERGSGQQKTQNIRIDIVVDGISATGQWSCGLEFDYANEESFYCRPLRASDFEQPDRMPVPSQASEMRVAYLPPMSGLAAVEAKLEPGRINVLMGEGQTAQVLRNLCYQIYERGDGSWALLCNDVEHLFGLKVLEPQYLSERGEITMSYKEPSGLELDLSSCGRGLHQTLLLIAHLYANPSTVLLLDEPDAHLEVLRQRQIYQLLTDIAQKQGSQIIAASHSEIILNEAAGRDIVNAFVGRPHRIDDRGSQVLKALKDIGYDHYYQAEQTGWVLYLEGPSDLAILKTFASSLEHEADSWLERPFIHYVETNIPEKAREHFYGLREAVPGLVGIALFDRLGKELQRDQPLFEMMWRKREIENYLCSKDVLKAFATADLPDDLFGHAEATKREKAMDDSIIEVTHALATLGKPGPWTEDVKASDDFLQPVFDGYFRRLGLPNLLQKSSYHILARHVRREMIDAEIGEKLNAIVAVARSAKPRNE